MGVNGNGDEMIKLTDILSIEGSLFEGNLY